MKNVALEICDAQKAKGEHGTGENEIEPDGHFDC